MTTRIGRRQAGFTLIELMIVVAIIGTLSAVAIPAFLNYQLKSKRVEAYTNLASLAKTQKGYFAEFNTYVAAAPEPSATTMEDPTTVKRDLAALRAAFSSVGWTPDGDVYYDYDTIIDGVAGCSCTTCFTATAYGNLDGDMFVSEFVFFHPDGSGGWCPVGVSGHGPPKDPVTNEIQWDMVVRHPNSDYY